MDNKNKFSHITLWLNDSPLMTLKDKIIPIENSVKYLGIIFTKYWTTRIKTKKKISKIKTT